MHGYLQIDIYYRDINYLGVFLDIIYLMRDFFYLIIYCIGYYSDILYPFRDLCYFENSRINRPTCKNETIPIFLGLSLVHLLNSRPGL